MTTEAGKRLLVDLDQQMASRHPHERYGVTDCWACAAVAAIEAEAVAAERARCSDALNEMLSQWPVGGWDAVRAEAATAERARIAEAVRGLPEHGTGHGIYVWRAAVLAIIEDSQPA